MKTTRRISSTFELEPKVIALMLRSNDLEDYCSGLDLGLGPNPRLLRLQEDGPTRHGLLIHVIIGRGLLDT
ncbi:hypothetical protein L195_g025478 [Trifolium pratense]|uniref:Uncharacterized protein n=1 Tax=Trifolium pratense TaxID=57577 RepID=A0A2K3NGK4_TRIPR|nr:hypothetical protein L195_g025478 [Trifolium pratense]